MGMNSIWCPVLDAYVTRVTDLENNVIRIICAEYQEPNGTCRLKKTAREGGPLTQLLERVSEHTLNSHGTMCELRST